MTKQESKIPEKILIGIKSRNKKKLYCKWGHILPRERRYERRTCKVCVEIRLRSYDKSESNHKQYVEKTRIKESKFPMIERLKIKGVMN